jgi:hypothetical protein
MFTGIRIVALSWAAQMGSHNLIPGRSRRFSPLHSTEISPDVHAASFSVVTRGYFPRFKVDEA